MFLVLFLDLHVRVNDRVESSLDSLIHEDHRWNRNHHHASPMIYSGVTRSIFEDESLVQIHSDLLFLHFAVESDWKWRTIYAFSYCLNSNQVDDHVFCRKNSKNDFLYFSDPSWKCYHHYHYYHRPHLFHHPMMKNQKHPWNK